MVTPKTATLITAPSTTAATTTAPKVGSGPVTELIKPVLTATTGVTNGNKLALENDTKATGGQLGSTLSKVTAGLTKGTSPTAKTGTHK